MPPPKAKAKGAAAEAKAAAAGKAKARAKGLGWGRGAGPKDTLLPPEPPPAATKRRVHCGWDADSYDNEVALAVPGELIEAVVRPQSDPLWPLRDRAGMPPKAKAKGSAAQAKADAAAAGKVKAQARGLDKGRGALPQGALQPPRPPPVATERWVRCSWDADYYDNEAALAAPDELTEAVIQDAGTADWPADAFVAGGTEVLLPKQYEVDNMLSSGSAKAHGSWTFSFRSTSCKCLLVRQCTKSAMNRCSLHQSFRPSTGEPLVAMEGRHTLLIILKQRHTLGGHGHFQYGGSAERQADIELLQEPLPRHKQLQDPRDPTTHQDSSQLFQLPSNARPQHRRTIDDDGRSPQRSRRSRQRLIVIGHGAFQSDCSVPDQADSELALEVLRQQGQLQEPDDQLAYAVSNQSLQLPSSTVPRRRHTVVNRRAVGRLSVRCQQHVLGTQRP